MLITGIDHVQLAMPAGEEDAARLFYAGLLGLREVEKPAPLASRGGCWFETPGTSVHLGVMKEFVPATKAHPAFTVQDLTALQESLRKAGITVTSDDALANENENIRRFFASDPFGNRIEFIQADDSLS